MKTVTRATSFLGLLFPFCVAHAFDIDTGNDDVSMRWDNTIKYNAAWRLKDPSSNLVNDNLANNALNVNLDDGDRNFNKGMISNRWDLLSEFDISYQKRFGARISGALWYDSVYNHGNDNNQPFRANQSSVPYNQFPTATRDIMGRQGQMLDAFVYANNENGNVRLGRHTILYGETLFFGANGIANAQAPIDYVKLLSVPGSTFKEVILPTNQISGQYSLTDNLTLGAYYQFEWEPSIIPPVGSYFSVGDVLGSGAENFLTPFGAIPRQADQQARNSGQFGAQLRWRKGDVEYGFYAARYHDKLFQAVLDLGLNNFRFIYPEDIKTFGASFSTVIGDINVAGEASVRRNAPLVGGANIVISPANLLLPSLTSAPVPLQGGVLYPVGNTAHVNLSAIAFFSGAWQPWDNSSLLAEVGWNRVTSVTENAAAIDPTTTRDAWGFRFIFEPQWFQVAPSLDLSAPIGLGYNPKGKSRAVQLFNGGVNKGGDLSIGLKGVYQQVWKAGLNYTHYLGSEAGALGADTYLTFKQSLADRDFVSFTLQRTF